ncbi:MAG: hypothetical protein ACOYL5_07750 [Phototrophicaceae bacterium]|jgi:hypothetical protein
MLDFPMTDGGANEPDFILNYIVAGLVNGIGVEIGITLMLRGLVMTGTMVSEKTYLEGVTKTLTEQIDFNDPNTPPEVRESIRQILDLRDLTEFSMADYMMANAAQMEEYEDDDEDDDFDDDDYAPDIPPPLQYLHIKDPMMLAGDPPVAFSEGSGVVIRIRMQSIDGWMLGRLLPNTPPDDFLDFGGDDSVRH